MMLFIEITSLIMSYFFTGVDFVFHEYTLPAYRRKSFTRKKSLKTNYLMAATWPLGVFYDFPLYKSYGQRSKLFWAIIILPLGNYLWSKLLLRLFLRITDEKIISLLLAVVVMFFLSPFFTKISIQPIAYNYPEDGGTHHHD